LRAHEQSAADARTTRCAPFNRYGAIPPRYVRRHAVKPAMAGLLSKGEKLCPAELLAQLILGPHQVFPARGRQAFAGPIDVEGEHGQRGSKRTALATPAFFGRSFQRCGDPLGIARCEDALLERQRVAVLRHMARPASARAPTGRAALSSATALAPGTPFRRGSFVCHRTSTAQVAIPPKRAS
jgi:hypothetical protein